MLSHQVSIANYHYSVLAFTLLTPYYVYSTGTSVGVSAGVAIPTLVPAVGLSCPGTSVSMSTAPKSLASVTAAVSCVMPLPIPTLSVAVTVDPLSSLRTDGLDTPVIDSPRGILLIWIKMSLPCRQRRR